MTTLNDLWWSLVRFGFRLLYNECAFAYDIVSEFVSLGQWHEWQKAALSYLPPPNLQILELAHGTGRLHQVLIEQGYTMVGIDASGFMGKIAKKRLLKAGLAPDLSCSTAGNLPFSHGQFNAIISTFPTSFILEEETLQEIHRVLDDDGILIVVYSGVLTGRGLISRFIELLFAVTGQRGSLQQYASPLLEKHGFLVDYVESQVKHSTVHLCAARKMPVSPTKTEENR